MSYWLNPALTPRQCQIAKAEFAVAQGYRTAFYQAELVRLMSEEAAETAAPPPAVDRHTDPEDHEVDQ